MICRSLFFCLLVFTGVHAQAAQSASATLSPAEKRARGLELLGSVLKPTMKELVGKVGDFHGPNPFHKHTSPGGDFETREGLKTAAANLISVVRKHYPIHHIATLGRDAIYIGDIFEMLEIVLGGGFGVTRLGASGGSVTGVQLEFLNHNGLLSPLGQPIKPFVAIDPTNWHTNSQLRTLVQGAYTYYGQQNRAQDLYKYVAGISTHALNSDGHFIADSGTTTPERLQRLLITNGPSVSNYVLNAQAKGLTYTANSFAWHGSFQTHTRGPGNAFINPSPGAPSSAAARETVLWIMYEIGAVISDPGFISFLTNHAKTRYQADIRSTLKMAFDKDKVRALIKEKGIISAYNYLEKETYSFLAPDGVKHFLDEAIGGLDPNATEKDLSPVIAWLLSFELGWNLLSELEIAATLKEPLLKFQDHLMALDPRKQEDAQILTRYFSTLILSPEQTLMVWQNTMEKVASTRRFGDVFKAMSHRLQYLELKPDLNYRSAFKTVEGWMANAKVTAPQRIQFWTDQFLRISKTRQEASLRMAGTLAVEIAELTLETLNKKLLEPTELAAIARSASALPALAKEAIAKRIRALIEAQAPSQTRALADYLSLFWPIQNLGLEGACTAIYTKNLPESVEGTLEAFNLVPNTYRSPQLFSAVQNRLVGRISSRLQLEASRAFLTDSSNLMIPQTREIVRRLIAKERGERAPIDFLLKELREQKQLHAKRDFELFYLVDLLMNLPSVSDPENVRKLLIALSQTQLAWAPAIMLNVNPPVVDMQGLLRSLKAEQATFENTFEFLALFVNLFSKPVKVPSSDALISRYFSHQYFEAQELLQQILNATVNLAIRFDQLTQIANIGYPFSNDLYEAIFHPALHLAPDFKTAMTLIPVFPKELALSYIEMAMERFPDQGDTFLERVLEMRDLYQISPSDVLEHLSPETVLKGEWQGHRVIELLNLLERRSELRTAYSKYALQFIDVKYSPWVFTTDKKVRKRDLASEWQTFRAKAYEREKEEIGFISAATRRLKRRMGWNGPVGNPNLTDPCQLTLEVKP